MAQAAVQVMVLAGRGLAALRAVPEQVRKVDKVAQLTPAAGPRSRDQHHSKAPLSPTRPGRLAAIRVGTSSEAPALAHHSIRMRVVSGSRKMTNPLRSRLAHKLPARLPRTSVARSLA